MSKRKKERSGLRKRCHCGAQRWNDCLHPWHFRLKLPGQAKRLRVNLQEHFNESGVLTRDAAEALADRYRVEVRAGASADVRLTLQDVCDRYVAAHVGKHYYLKILCNSDVPAPNGATVKLGTKALPDITGDDIEHAADVRQAPAQPGPRGGLDAS